MPCTSRSASFGDYRLTSLASSVISHTPAPGRAKGGGRKAVNLGLTHPNAGSTYNLWPICGIRWSLKMTDAKLAPKLPGWMVEHANRSLCRAAPTGTCTSHPAGHNRTVAAADDDRPKAGGEVHLTTVLRKTGDSYIVV